jgi:hypothetical protein
MSSNRVREWLQALCIACFVIALSVAMSKTEAREIKVHFAKGETSQTFRAQWENENETYVFRAKKGQRISIQLNDGRKSSTKLRATLYKYCGDEYGEPMAASVATFEGPLPCTDQYSIDISRLSDESLKVDEIEYRLTISIR